ncbi:MAG: hypothetical protein LC749_21290 [Actinobacteria bacterium]|nr:hypothetical protein [Actinomycetota bacterium]
MAFREVDVVEVREVLRGWLEGTGLRTVAKRAGVDRKICECRCGAPGWRATRLGAGDYDVTHARSGRFGVPSS